MAFIGTAQEEGTYPIVLTYTLGGSALTPDSVTWTLSRPNKTIVNAREDVVIETPGTTNTIAPSGDDLAILSDSDIDRVITAKIVYSPGSLPQNAQAEFKIKPLDQVP
ncbi:hypothetical protein LCGC14_1919190 [marine sediment metagenome]|uniref:MBG domain-containing protein n=1 Tax=marine sediment metagenome TaxID=412755 RepID=A0A0F9FS46_9ZZZZ